MALFRLQLCSATDTGCLSFLGTDIDAVEGHQRQLTVPWQRAFASLDGRAFAVAQGCELASIFFFY